MKSFNILILEDEANDAFEIQQILGSSHTYLIAKNAVELRKIIGEKNPIDLGIFDIRIESDQETNGISLASEVLQHMRIPIIFSTQFYEDPEYFGRCG